MPLLHLRVASVLRWLGRPSPAISHTNRRRLRPAPESLEPRLALDGSITTYTWTALGNGMSWNDPKNWSHPPVLFGLGQTGVPTAGSNIFFPPISTLPANSPTTINFNSPYFSFPIGLFTIEGSYTFQGNPITINNGIIVTNPPGGLANPTILLSGLTMTPQSTIYTYQGSTLNLADAANPTGLQLNLQNGVTKGGSGQLVIDTQSIRAPYVGFNLQPFEIAGGSVTIGASSTYTGSRFIVDPGGGLDVADNVALSIGGLSGSGTVNLAGTTAAGDTTSLTIMEPGGQSDVFRGPIDGLGQLILQGNGTLTTGAIDFADAGSIQVLLGTLNANGAVSAGSLAVKNGATFGGIGPWSFSGSAVFQSNTDFNVTLNGLTPGTQYTQLVDADTTTGINLGGSALTGSVNYQYQAGDTFTIATGQLLQGTFRNVAGGTVLLGNNVPFAVTYSNTSVTLTALQSLTTTRLSTSLNPSNPGLPVTFTATVSTRTNPVITGTVSFVQGGTVLATVPLNGAGMASYTTTTLPLGNTTITAVYNGNSSILGSTSPAVTESVVPYTTATALGSSPNPSRTGQPVTLTATVTAIGSPVAVGMVKFTRGNRVLGTAALESHGTASLTIGSLPKGKARIQAIYEGTTDYFPSVSPVLSQRIDKSSTATSLTFTTQVQPDGQVLDVLKADVVAVGGAGILPIGRVVFRRNGRVIGRASLNNGTAWLTLGRHTPARGRFLVSFRGSSRFKPSTSPPLRLQG
jgi:hypothetical protein